MKVMPTQEHAIRCIERLGISLPCDMQQLKSAFRAKARETHPDTETGNAHDFGEVRAAYDFLVDNSHYLEQTEVSRSRSNGGLTTDSNSPFHIDRDPRKNYGPCPTCNGTGKPTGDEAWWSDICIKCYGTGEIELFNPVLPKFKMAGSRQQRKPKKAKKIVTGRFVTKVYDKV